MGSKSQETAYKRAVVESAWDASASGNRQDKSE
jgi:hypothetical protein